MKFIFNFSKTRVLQSAILSGAVLHAGFVLWGSLNPERFRSASVPTAAFLYGQISGAVSNVKFFSPNIGSQLGVQYRGFIEDNEVMSGDLLTGNREADLRILKMTSFYSNPSLGQKERRSLLASWAGRIFAEHPQLEMVEIDVSYLDLPSMLEFRQGKRPSWFKIYSAKFNRSIQPEAIL